MTILVLVLTVCSIVAAPLAASGEEPVPLALRAVLAKGVTGGDLQTGLYVRSDVDLLVPGTIPLALVRTYRTQDSRSRSFGVGANDNYDMFLVGDATTFSYVDLILSDGGRIHYVRKGPWTTLERAILEHSATPTVYLNSKLTWNGREWDIRFADGSLMQMSGCNSTSRAGQCGILSVNSASQRLLTMTRNGEGDLMRVAGNDQHSIDFDYDPWHRIVRARDNTGHATNYLYDGGGHLISVRTVSGLRKRYAYDAADNLVRIAEPSGRRIRNYYDTTGRVSAQDGNWRGSFKFRYTADAAAKTRTTTVTEPDRSTTTVTFNADGYSLLEVHRFGSQWKATAEVKRVPGSNAIVSVNVSCQPGGNSAALSPSQWNDAHILDRRYALDIVCLALLHDARTKSQTELAMKSNAQLSR